MMPGLGLGVALKIDDGTTRASEVVMAAILDVLGVFDAPLRKSLHAVMEPTVFNAAGDNVGVVRASSTLSENVS